MIKRYSKRQVITDKFGSFRSYGSHQGVDLRSRRFQRGKGWVEQWALQAVIAPEKCKVLRMGRDSKGNGYIVVQPKETDYAEIKLIHVDIDRDISIGQTLERHAYIGHTELKGSSRAHHLHFEVWKVISGVKRPMNPVEYFISMRIKYKFKGKA